MVVIPSPHSLLICTRMSRLANCAHLYLVAMIIAQVVALLLCLLSAGDSKALERSSDHSVSIQQAIETPLTLQSDNEPPASDLAGKDSPQLEQQSADDIDGFILPGVSLEHSLLARRMCWPITHNGPVRLTYLDPPLRPPAA